MVVHPILHSRQPGYRVAAGLPPQPFDRLFVDVYDGTETVPYGLVTLEGMRELADRWEAQGKEKVAPGFFAILKNISEAGL